MMENKIPEGKIDGAIEPIEKEKMKIIIKQMERSICKVFGTKVGTGFFCLIKINNKKIPALITNYHIIDDKFLKVKKELKIQLNDSNGFHDKDK